MEPFRKVFFVCLFVSLVFFFCFFPRPGRGKVAEMETADGIGGLSALCIRASFFFFLPPVLREIMIEP